MISPPARKGAKSLSGPNSCIYCKRIFETYRALGGHLRVHQPGKLSRSRSRLARLAKYRRSYRNFPLSIPNIKQLSSNPPPAARATSLFGFPRVFRSNGMNQAHKRTFSGSNRGLDVSLNSSLGSSANVIYQSSCFSSAASALNGGPSPISPTSISLSSRSVATKTPLDLTLRVGSDAIFQFNTDTNLSICSDGLPSLGHTGRYPGKLLNSYFALSDPNCTGGSYQSHIFKKHAAVGGFSPGNHRYSGTHKRQNDLSSALSDILKRLNLGEGSSVGGALNALKKPKNIACLAMESEEPPNKNLQYPVDVDSSICVSEALRGVKGQVYLDLSLHL